MPHPEIGNLLTALDFKKVDTQVPPLPHPQAPPFDVCLAPFPSPIDDLPLSALAALNPFP